MEWAIKLEKKKPFEAFDLKGFFEVVWEGIEPPTQGFSVFCNMVQYVLICSESVDFTDFYKNINLL